ncbi:hypothetical protein [Thioalkalivibrio sp. AKL10]|nr:hypothetical protein [Thioalkalivibrio sp. AKL10]
MRIIAVLPDLMGDGAVHDLHQALVHPAANEATFGKALDRAA